MKKIFVILFALCALPVFAKYSGDISLDKKDGFYKSGETATCQVLLKKDGTPLKGVKARLLLKKEGKTISSEIFETDGKAKTFTGSLDAPGWLYFGFEVLGSDGKALKGKGVCKHRAKPSIVTEIGALFDADKIISPNECPADFDKFWAKRRAELDKVPVEAKLTPLECKEKNVKLYAVEVKCSGSRPVTGYLAVPADAKPGKSPAVVEFLSWVNGDASKTAPVARAKQGVLAFYATWHGFPVNQTKEFYVKNIRAAVQGGRKDITNRDKWVMGEVYLRVMRALDYIKTRPEWDKKTLVVVGGSLGGAQTAAAAALDKDVTLALVGVPCFSEFDNRKSGRASSTPVRRSRLVKKEGDRLFNAVAYFDIVNFAPRTKCEVFVCTGFADETCAPSNVYAYYNALKCKKSMSTNPRTGHFGTTKNIKGNKKLEELVGSITVYNYRVHK
ncbi:MAG: acetylxylan esterase [Lentisphaerae bacterium]|nr:acetylxylan esterase [Lentisphaerota bacterium]